MPTFPKTTLIWSLPPGGESKAKARNNKDHKERRYMNQRLKAPNGECSELARELAEAHTFSIGRAFSKIRRLCKRVPEEANKR